MRATRRPGLATRLATLASEAAKEAAVAAMLKQSSLNLDRSIVTRADGVLWSSCGSSCAQL